METCYRESRITFEKQLRSSFGPRARDSSDLTDSSASEESSRRSTEHDRQLDGMLQSQLNSRAQHNPPESVPATDHSAVPWYRACALRVVSHRDFEFVVMFITIVNCVGLALYSPLQPPTHSCNVWMDTIGVHPRLYTLCPPSHDYKTLQLHVTLRIILPSGNPSLCLTDA